MCACAYEVDTCLEECISTLRIGTQVAGSRKEEGFMEEVAPELQFE